MATVEWLRGEIPSQVFQQLAEAKFVFPDLELKHSSKRFQGPTVDRIHGETQTRFDTEEVWERLSVR